MFGRLSRLLSGPLLSASLAHLPPRPPARARRVGRGLRDRPLCALPAFCSFPAVPGASTLSACVIWVSVFPNTFPANPDGLQFSLEEDSVMKCGKKSLTVRTGVTYPYLTEKIYFLTHKQL